MSLDFTSVAAALCPILQTGYVLNVAGVAGHLTIRRSRRSLTGSVQFVEVKAKFSYWGSAKPLILVRETELLRLKQHTGRFPLMRCA